MARKDPAATKAARAKYYHDNKDKQDKAAIKAALAAHYLANKEQYRIRSAEYRAKNKERIRIQAMAYRAANKEKIKAYREATKEQCNQNLALRRATDIQFIMTRRVRQRLRNALARTKTEKTYATFDLIGCSIQYLLSHLESQFQDGMSWDNRSEWHIDHRIPCSSFDLTDQEQQKLCFHWTNLQPLWGVDNIKKGTKLET